jgi:hypothetical protein
MRAASIAADKVPSFHVRCSPLGRGSLHTQTAPLGGGRRPLDGRQLAKRETRRACRSQASTMALPCARTAAVTESPWIGLVQCEGAVAVVGYRCSSLYSDAKPGPKTWHHPTRPQDVIDLRYHVGNPQLGKMYDGVRRDRRQRNEVEQGHGLSLLHHARGHAHVP